MKYIALMVLFFNTLLLSQELQIKATSFSADENKGISTFEGDVNILKLNDELNASKVVVYTDAEKKPTMFIVTGSVSFKIETKDSAKYRGTANKVVYQPEKKEYLFYGNVHLLQLDEKKEIHGDEVVLSIVDGKAHAKGQSKDPVIMIFDIKEEK